MYVLGICAGCSDGSLWILASVTAVLHMVVTEIPVFISLVSDSACFVLQFLKYVTDNVADTDTAAPMQLSLLQYASIVCVLLLAMLSIVCAGLVVFKAV